MTMPSVLSSLSWMNVTSSVLTTTMQSQAALDQSIGQLLVASELGNAKQQASIQTNIEQLKEQTAKLKTVLYKRTGVTTLEEALVIVEDLKMRLEKANGQFSEWRKTFVAADYIRERGQVITAEEQQAGKPGTTQAQIDGALAATEEEYFESVRILEASIPQARSLVLA